MAIGRKECFLSIQSLHTPGEIPSLATIVSITYSVICDNKRDDTNEVNDTQ